MRTPLEDKYLSADNSLRQVATVDGKILNPEIFTQRYLKKGTPVIITGLLDSELSWDLDFLCEKLKNQKFPFRFSGWERYQKNKSLWKNIGSGVETHSLSFSEYADLLSSKEAHKKDIYLGRCALKNTPLADDAKIFTEVDAKLGLKPAPIYGYVLEVT